MQDLTVELLAEALTELAADAMVAIIAAYPGQPCTAVPRWEVSEGIAACWGTRASLVELARRSATRPGQIKYFAQLGHSERNPDLLALGAEYLRRTQARKGVVPACA